MTQAVRQSELFAAKDWKLIYQAFTQVNFNAYDFNSIRQAMVTYIQNNYPEDFNDWVESAELVAIIDLLAYLGESLAYRMDLNTRENFIDTAERRESILRLATLLSYKPSRNQPARGIIKLIGVRTDDNVFDSNGTNLKGITINWNDPNNPDWFEQFINVLNASFLSSNGFGQPVKSGSLLGVPSQLYQFNSIPINSGLFSFSAFVDGLSLDFELVNPDFEDLGTIKEQDPDPTASYHLIYMNDGNGNGSPNTGFFTYLKQGTLQFLDFNLTLPIENRVLDIAVNNINQFDVFVQSIDSAGFVQTKWTPVPATYGTNVIFNSITQNIRNIFEVVTGSNDQISIRFGDGRFGTIPTGLIRVWYRVSANQIITVRPQDIQNVTVSLPYTNVNNTTQNLQMTFSLQQTIANATTSETDTQIKINAPRIYYSQNRMVNGEDYNVYPLINPNALKIKAVNRIYAGHSRYININDPTGLYNDTNIYADDGILWKNFDTNYNEILNSQSLTADQIMVQYVQPALQNVEQYQFLLDAIRKSPDIYKLPAGFPLVWVKSNNSNFSSTGYFSIRGQEGTPIQIGVAVPAVTVYDMITEGALIKFQNTGWVSVAIVANHGLGFQSNGQGTVTLSEPVPAGDMVINILPAIRTTLTSAEYNAIKSNIDTLNPQQFAIYYDWRSRIWNTYLFPGSFDMNPADFTLYNPATAPVGQETGWLIIFQPQNDGFRRWIVRGQALQYIFESTTKVRFYFVAKYKSVDLKTGLSNRDSVKIFGSNSVPLLPQDSWAAGTDRGNPLKNDILFALTDNFTYPDGYIEPRRVLVTFWSSLANGIPDDPESFDEVVLENSNMFWSSYNDQYGYRYYQPALGVKIRNDPSTLDVPTHLQLNDIVWIKSTDLFYQVISMSVGQTMMSNLQQIEDASAYVREIGRPSLNFQWKHFAPTDHRIDPAISNIIDIFVLTVGYDTDIRSWIASGAPVSELPSPPSAQELSNDFADLETNKMFTDQIIWRPVTYKLLFGTRADPEYQASFKVIKVPGTTLSDGQIKSQIISAMSAYFGVQNWDFGDTFYWSELATYLHIQLATSIASIVLVPTGAGQQFGDLQSIPVGSNEIVISAATVDDIEIVPTLTETTLRVNG